MNFFTSDLHFGHHNIIPYCNRPFHDEFAPEMTLTKSAVQEMNETLIENWNGVVSPQDRVYIAGDLAMGKLAETLPLCLQLNGEKALIPGNHDRCWKGHKKTANWAQKYEEVDVLVYDSEIFLQIEEFFVKLCHFPYTGDHSEFDRYSDERPIKPPLGYGEDFLIHGHVHDMWKKNGNQINVGVDAWDYKPVSERQLLELMRSDLKWLN